MPLVGSGKPRPRAIVRSGPCPDRPPPGMRYAVEEASSASPASGAAAPLSRSISFALSPRHRRAARGHGHADRCEGALRGDVPAVCMKRLLVHEGAGMARTRSGELIDSRHQPLPLAIAIKQPNRRDRPFRNPRGTPEGEPGIRHPASPPASASSNVSRKNPPSSAPKPTTATVSQRWAPMSFHPRGRPALRWQAVQ